MSKGMTRDEARVWMAANPGEEVRCDGMNSRFRMDSRGKLEFYYTLRKGWEPAEYGLYEDQEYAPVKPSPPEPSELPAEIHLSDAFRAVVNKCFGYRDNICVMPKFHEALLA